MWWSIYFSFFTTPQNITVIILQIVFIALDHKDNCKFPVLASPSKMRGVSFLIGSKKFLIAEIDHKNILCSDNPLVYNIKNIYELTIYIILCIWAKYIIRELWKRSLESIKWSWKSRFNSRASSLHIFLYFNKQLECFLLST